MPKKPHRLQTKEAHLIAWYKWEFLRRNLEYRKYNRKHPQPTKTAPAVRRRLGLSEEVVRRLSGGAGSVAYSGGLVGGRTPPAPPRPRLRSLKVLLVRESSSRDAASACSCVVLMPSRA